MASLVVDEFEQNRRLAALVVTAPGSDKSDSPNKRAVLLRFGNRSRTLRFAPAVSFFHLKSNTQKECDAAKNAGDERTLSISGPQKIGGDPCQDHRHYLKNSIHVLSYVLFISSSAIWIMDLGLACLFRTYLIITNKGKPMNSANGMIATINVTSPRTKFIATSKPR